MEKNSNINPLEITEEEKDAMKAYGRGKRISDAYYTYIYSFINSLFFEGIDSEIIRLFEDKKNIEPELVFHMHEIIDIIERLYSSMYKYGKTMEKERLGHRLEREQSFEMIRKEGKTKSNFSTSAEYYNVMEFGKKSPVLLEVHIEPGTPCVEYHEVLEETYEFYKEKEILIAPGCIVSDIVELEDYAGYTRYRITVSSPEKAKPLTKEEISDKQRQMELIMDEEFLYIVKTVLEEMQELKTEIDIAQFAKKIFNDKQINIYTRWKSSIIQYLKYRFREIELEIEAALEEQSKYNPEDVLGLSELDMNYEAVGETIKTTVSEQIKQLKENGNEEK